MVESIFFNIIGEIIAGLIIASILVGVGFFWKTYKSLNLLSKRLDTETRKAENTHKRLEKADKNNKKILFTLGDLIVNGISKEEKAKRLKMLKDLTEE